MGLGILGSFVVLAVCFRPLVCQQPNTDGFFLYNFLQNMGLNPSKVHNLSANFCSWEGVLCDSKEQRVVKLIASGLGLSGMVSENTIGKLTMLEILDLSNNNLTGLPSDIWSLGSLKSLDLSFNRISGALSNNVGNFAKLERLDLSCNNFSGSIPESMSSLTSLKSLNLSRNGFDSKVPSGIMNFHSLVSLDLSRNSLCDGFGAAFPKLMFLNLSGNLFTVVGVLGGSLEVIDLSRNQFEGHISQLNFSWSNLVHLDLSENRLTGEISPELNNAKSLKHLNLAFNRFSREPFPHIHMLPLEYLNLSGTNLSGEIPREILSLSSLKTLDVSRNRLTSRIPAISAKKLQVLDVSYNNLTGEIPQSVVEMLHSMVKFNFSYNNVTFCASQVPPDTLRSAFIGSTSGCPIAADPSLFEGKAPQKRWGLKLALILAFSVVFILLGLLFLAFGRRRGRRQKDTKWAVKRVSYKEDQSVSGPFSFRTDSTAWVADVKQSNSVPVVIFEKPLLDLTFSDLLTATSNFGQGTLLGEGRFGPVYGGFLPGGIHVAVKVLVHGSTVTNQEAARELEYLGRIKHPNLVPLTGYCLAGDQRIAIYDYMENGNLHGLLHDLPLGLQRTEDWSTDTWEHEGGNGIENVGSEGLLTTWRFRHKIALGTARALAFLHHGCSPPIIHRDVKASSIYLDASLEPRLSDFGLAKMFGLEDEIAPGSPGYIPPEFLTGSPNSPTPKSDVYGFGVVLFELMTGKKPVGDDYPEEKDGNLVSWVRGLVRKGQGLRAVDPKIIGTGSETQIEEALKIGYLCTAEIHSKRPSMHQVVGLLKDIDSATAQ